MPLVRSFFPILAFATVYVAITLVITNSYYQLMMTLVLVWATFGLSWNILSGYTGLVSFGHAAFFGIGAYTTALGQMHFDLSPWLLIPIAALFGGLSGLLIGFRHFDCAATISLWQCSPIPWQCSTCSNGLAIKKSRSQ